MPESICDYPLYYDILFGWDRSAEAQFYATAFARHGGSIAAGGVYGLDMAFVVGDDAPVHTTDESWTMRRGDIVVEGTDALVNVDDRGVKRTLAWGAETHLRPYTYAAFAERVRVSGGFTLVACHAVVNGADGIGRFDANARCEPPLGGRAMLVLQRART